MAEATALTRASATQESKRRPRSSEVTAMQSAKADFGQLLPRLQSPFRFGRCADPFRLGPCAGDFPALRSTPSAGGRA
jgi:hypothetical protein